MYEELRLMGIAKGVHNLVCTDQFVYTLLHLRDILPLLSDMNLALIKMAG